MKKIKLEKLSSARAYLKDFCILSKEHDEICVIPWNNGEGYDIMIDKSNGNKFISLTHGELHAIKSLINYLEINE